MVSTRSSFDQNKMTENNQNNNKRRSSRIQDKEEQIKKRAMIKEQEKQKEQKDEIKQKVIQTAIRIHGAVVAAHIKKPDIIFPGIVGGKLNGSKNFYGVKKAGLRIQHPTPTLHNRLHCAMCKSAVL